MTLSKEEDFPMKTLGTRRDAVAMRVYGDKYAYLCGMRQDAVDSTIRAEDREDRQESGKGG